MMATSYNLEFDPEDLDSQPEKVGIVPIGGELPFNVQIPTSKLLDILIASSPGAAQFTARQKKSHRTKLSNRLYPRTRPGF
jgi:hypothetical protein